MISNASKSQLYPKQVKMLRQKYPTIRNVTKRSTLRLLLAAIVHAIGCSLFLLVNQGYPIDPIVKEWPKLL